MFEQTSPKWPNLDLQLFRFISSHMWLMIGQKVTELKKKGNQGNQGNQATKGIHDWTISPQRSEGEINIIS